jgi:hypothetical protein
MVTRSADYDQDVIIVHVDPKAPGDSPHHPSNIDLDADDSDWYEEDWADIEHTHLTEAERAADEQKDADTVRAELEMRVNALVQYLEARDLDSDAEAPTMVDMTGTPHQLVVNEDGSEAHWESLEVDQDDDGYDDLTVPQLGEMLKGRELPHTGVKPDLIARLRENDAERAQEADQDGDADGEADDLDAALAELDAMKGSK